MVLMDRLEKSNTEALHMRSERVLESDRSILSFGQSMTGRDQKGDRRFCLKLMDKENGFYTEFIREDQGKWIILENGQDMGSVTPEKINNDYGCGNRMIRKAIMGMIEEVDDTKHTYRTIDFLKKGLSRVGLSVSKDGSVQEMSPNQMQRGQGRS